MPSRLTEMTEEIHNLQCKIPTRFAHILKNANEKADTIANQGFFGIQEHGSIADAGAAGSSFVCSFAYITGLAYLQFCL